MKKIILLISIFSFSLFSSYSPLPTKKALEQLKLGINNISKEYPINQKIAVLIDFTLPSNEKRMYIISLKELKIIKQTYVSHGKNSGELYADSFSNENNSKKSSLGFFITAEEYIGNHGKSLRLDGIDKGFNDLARKRFIVMHGAEYSTEEFAQEYGRLGRSWGCPAFPQHEVKEIIPLIKNGVVLFIYADKDQYLQNSKWLKT